MSLESQASPPARKTSTVKGFGKGTGAGGGGLGSSSSPKTFQCTGYPGCNMVFTRSEHLARHERKHTGEKPYKCIVANCPRTFSRYDNMIQHTQTHSDRTKRDSLAAVAAAASAAAAGGGGGGPIGSGPHSRSSSVQSTPLLPGRPRGGSSPVVFGPSWDDHHHRRTTQNNSPASPYSASPAFAHQHHQQQQQQSHHPSHHPIQWSLPSGAPAGSSPALSAQYYSHHHGAESHPYLPGHQGPSTPVVRTLKANSRSLPHLQARASPMALSSSSSTSESPSVGLQQSMSTMEIEELKRRKSEVLLPSSFSGAARAATMSTTTGFGQGIGLGVSPFTPTTSHPQSLPQVEKLTAGEQERLNEHRRSAQAMFFKMNSGREGSMDAARTPEYPDVRPGSQQQYQQPLPQQQQQPLGTSSSTPRSGSTGPALPHVQQLSAQEKDRLLEHRKSTPELMNDMRMKRSSNDPADMVVQPLPSRDSRSGMQWFSQVSTPLTSSPRTSLTPREGSGGSFSVQGHGTNSSSTGHTSGESPVILPPIMGPYEDLQRDRQGRLRSHSSHIHPLSRPSAQFDPSSLAQFSSSEESKDQQRQQFDAALSPRLERHWEDQYFPIRKRHVVEAIERMDSREYLGLKYQVAEHHANEQFRNPEFLGNMTAILCVIRAPQTTWKGGERRQGSQGSVASASEHGGNSLAGSRRTSRDMEVDESDRANMATATKAATPSAVVKTEEGVGNETESMDLDDADSRITSKDVVFQPCRFALDIDVDSFSRDPEPDLRGFESLTINSLFPTRSFVAGFEDTTTVENASEKKDQYVSSQGYPTNARLGRFYLPERSYRTPESLLIQPDSRDQWVCCRFEEYHGVSIWVLESVLDKYHEISRRHKMALTLVGATIHHREAVYSREDWEIHSGERYEVKTKESALYPEMIHQVWRDMYHQHHQRAQQHHHHQQQQYQQQQQHLPSMPQVATYEEYQRSLMQSDPRRDSYQQHSQQAPPPRDRASGPYYSYSDYRQQQQSMHREDLSSAPSSPQSPRHDDFHDETPHHQHQQQQQQQQNQQRQGSTANMHRRISIAELCNPMQSLATERAQRREETASKRTSM
ncbi:hypothetical protein EC991_009887 [Linnemannia zychae]|nr:hypothetical protein EC991_009887 [Linnemannia zychae]